MALCLAERYSSLSPRNCLHRDRGSKVEDLAGDPLTDLSLTCPHRSFAVPPGIEVGEQ